ncbi:MAG TPA: family 16 glycosylhydrolase [Polyangiaceae bacterium]|nr:family 16 glycosylhydrolase [Polyangiaceae bacterium]
MLRRGSIVSLLVPGLCLLAACDDGSGGGDLGAGGAASGGGAAVGGSPSAGGTASGGSSNPELPEPDDGVAPEREGFTLLWHDGFDTLDSSRWQAGTHTFTENAAQFGAEQVSVAEGYLKLSLVPLTTPSAENRQLGGAELRTLESFGHGRFETRARFASGSGVVSSIFTYYDHWADASLPENWNEIDVEFLGKDNAGVQFNVIHWNAQNQRTTHEKHHGTGFDPSAEFHDYAIEWLPDVVRFYVDEQLVHEQTDAIAQFLTLDQKLMMNVWAVMDTPALEAWAGKFESSSLPTAAYYDWVRVYSYDGP